ncbi:hypothetical protein PENTCL1PPCAC_23477, partial [Pristionchus entomophagus]
VDASLDLRSTGGVAARAKRHRHPQSTAIPQEDRSGCAGSLIRRTGEFSEEPDHLPHPRCADCHENASDRHQHHRHHLQAHPRLIYSFRSIDNLFPPFILVICSVDKLL